MYFINIGMECDVILQRIMKQFHGDDGGLQFTLNADKFSAVACCKFWQRRVRLGLLMLEF